MTAKRYSNLDVWKMGAENTAKLLNELHEENQRLRSTNQKQAELFGVQVEKMIKETDDFLKEVFKVEK